MFPKMRRAAQELSRTECEEILSRCTSGVLALSGGEYPYGVPLSYVYTDGKIFFHSAPEGHKVDIIRQNPKASFCVIGADNVIPEKYTTAYKSVIAFGTVRIIEEPEEKLSAAIALGKRYAPNDPEGLEKELESLNRCLLLEFSIDHMIGKQGKELIKN